MRVMGRLAALPACALLIGACLAACGGSTKNAGGSTVPSQQGIDQLDIARPARRDVECVGHHQWTADPRVDESLQGGTIDGKYVPTLRTLIRSLALTDWTPDLKAQADQLRADAVALFQALNAGKPASELKDMSANLHDGVHDFTPAVGNAVTEGIPADAGGPEPTHAASTPATGGTASAGATTTH